MVVALVVVAALVAFLGLPLLIGRRLDRVSGSYPPPARARLSWRRARRAAPSGRTLPR